LTAEQLEAARAERMRQNGHGAISIEDVRTWIEETGLCVFLPRSTQGGQPILSTPTATPTFVEAVAGQRVNQPTLDLIQTAESLLVRLEAEGVAVRLNLAGQPGEHPDYVVAGWVLPYIYALRGDRDWRRSPQLTGSRQVSQLAVHAAKHLDTANLTATQIRDALGKEVTEVAVLRALHELWKQLRIIPVVPEVGAPALWQPLRQRFQKAIAEGASTSQVTAISVLASIYLQAVIAASMEDIEMFLSPLTSRSKIREVVRGLAATRQVHSTNMGQSPMFYVAGTLPEFAPVPSYEIGASQAYRSSNYRSSTYLSTYLRAAEEEEHHAQLTMSQSTASNSTGEARATAEPVVEHRAVEHKAAEHRTVEHVAAKPAASVSGSARPRKPLAASPSFRKAQASGKTPSAGKSAAPRPRGARSSGNARPTHGRGHAVAETRGAGNRNGAAPARNGNHSNGSHAKSSNGNGAHRNGNGNGHHVAKPVNGAWKAKPAGSRPEAKSNGKAKVAARPVSNGNGHRNGSATKNGTGTHAAGRKPVVAARGGKSVTQKAAPRTASRPAARPVAKSSGRAAAASSAGKRYSFAGHAKVQAKPAPKPARKPVAAASRATAKTAARPAARSAKPVAKAVGKAKGKPVASVRHSSSSRTATAKRRG
jgi:23S rRNA pseudouridine2605 synthase